MYKGKNPIIEGLKFDSYWIDLLMLLLLVYILITVALIISIRKEYEAKIDLLKKQEKKVSDGFGLSTPKLTLMKKNDKFLFILSGQKIGKQVFYKLENLLAEIKKFHPQSLILRIDQNSPFKYTQEILILARQLNMSVGFAYEVGGN